MCVVPMESVCVREWNFSHVILGSEGQSLQENPHIPQRTGTDLKRLGICRFVGLYQLGNMHV